MTKKERKRRYDRTFKSPYSEIGMKPQARPAKKKEKIKRFGIFVKDWHKKYPQPKEFR